MKISILDNTKKKEFIEGIKHLGITKIPQLLVRSGEERIRAYSGSLSGEEVMEVWRLLPIEGVGLYVGKDMIDRHGVREIRLSIEGLHVWQKQIQKNVVVLTSEQEKEWFKGRNIELKAGEYSDAEGFVAIKSSDGKDFIGTGKIGHDRKVIYNFLPKERRRRSNTFSS